MLSVARLFLCPLFPPASLPAHYWSQSKLSVVQTREREKMSSNAQMDAMHLPPNAKNRIHRLPSSVGGDCHLPAPTRRKAQVDCWTAASDLGGLCEWSSCLGWVGGGRLL
ncbi:hypothetical protein GGTG_11624 [Gaeumannomyces tritici R3-111a-1]|uniref:Uncharacterized protein n=1 Tax=Gaeumannomyces tritici (strain R3-111a-1) TaxID=644352 RepID=J3PDQ1_GAET3|nr:hypothetical protein GGTG_11624 [Gaeumannomyces tritici R3-111a-1]EJT70601.1 hypothetical protein GGTG_11624 [Gaeumannomyces tritici R3-111a-1]